MYLNIWSQVWYYLRSCRCFKSGVMQREVDQWGGPWTLSPLPASTLLSLSLTISQRNQWSHTPASMMGCKTWVSGINALSLQFFWSNIFIIAIRKVAHNLSREKGVRLLYRQASSREPRRLRKGAQRKGLQKELLLALTEAVTALYKQQLCGRRNCVLGRRYRGAEKSVHSLSLQHRTPGQKTLPGCCAG